MALKLLRKYVEINNQRESDDLNSYEFIDLYKMNKIIVPVEFDSFETLVKNTAFIHYDMQTFDRIEVNLNIREANREVNREVNKPSTLADSKKETANVQRAPNSANTYEKPVASSAMKPEKKESADPSKVKLSSPAVNSAIKKPFVTPSMAPSDKTKVTKENKEKMSPASTTTSTEKKTEAKTPENKTKAKFSEINVEKEKVSAVNTEALLTLWPV
jgi:hypothetical protein